ncbi:hypothetical protein ACOSQ3_006982 [Xanthoceras sorbifolium]
MKNEVKVEAEYIGVVRLHLSLSHFLELNDTVYILSISRNLIYVSLLDRADYTFHFSDGKVFLYRDNVYIGFGTLCDGLYMIDLIPNFAQSSSTPKKFRPKRQPKTIENSIKKSSPALDKPSARHRPNRATSPNLLPKT